MNCYWSYQCNKETCVDVSNCKHYEPNNNSHYTVKMYYEDLQENSQIYDKQLNEMKGDA